MINLDDEAHALTLARELAVRHHSPIDVWEHERESRLGRLFTNGSFVPATATIDRHRVNAD